MKLNPGWRSTGTTTLRADLRVPRVSAPPSTFFHRHPLSVDSHGVALGRSAGRVGARRLRGAGGRAR
jgi:hypothetical protein